MNGLKASQRRARCVSKRGEGRCSTLGSHGESELYKITVALVRRRDWGRAGGEVSSGPGESRAFVRSDGEGMVRMGGCGTLRQVELQDGSSVRAWTATVAAGRGVGRPGLSSPVC